MDFLEYVYGEIYARYPIDPTRQALLGYSDGASYVRALPQTPKQPLLRRAGGAM